MHLHMLITCMFFMLIEQTKHNKGGFYCGKRVFNRLYLKICFILLMFVLVQRVDAESISYLCKYHLTSEPELEHAHTSPRNSTGLTLCQRKGTAP